MLLPFFVCSCSAETRRVIRKSTAASYKAEGKVQHGFCLTYSMRILFPLTALVIALFAFAFTRPVISDEVPAFPGGDTALKCHYKTNLNRKIVLDSTNAGLYVVRFTVDTAGNVSDAEIAKAPPASTSAAQQEVIRVTKLMPKWIPGYQGDEWDIDPDEGPDRENRKPLRVNVKMQYPVRFPQILDWECPKK